MSIAAAQYSKFKQQVIAGQQVWTFTEEGDDLVIPVKEGEAIPFWSSKSRLMKICSYHAKYSRYERASLPFAEFLKMLERLSAEKISIGVNWSGKSMVGYDVQAEELLTQLRSAINKRSESNNT